ncbi:hypothetical protein EWM64_g5128 [Hericium alpestre]|uniref:Uncharacterized protein n=1 Tax=Hericium alpestre TaxID=135208 RepID=A0A4Y9ZXX8_9AGAM|nr:hypothetical protein EWM64_g5128 [Hericium alpestre]
MSLPSKFSSSASVAPVQAVHQVVQPHVVRFTISARESMSESMAQHPPGSPIPEQWNALQAINAAYQNGQMSSDEYDVALARITAAASSTYTRLREFNGRVSAGEARPRDIYKEMCGYTEEQTEEWIKQLNSSNGRGH